MDIMKKIAKQHKVFILLLFLFLLCGCDATVNVNISNGSIKEDVVIVAFPDESYTTKERLNAAFRDYFPAFYNNTVADEEPDEKKSGVQYYEKSVADIGEGSRYEYKYNYTIDNYIGSSTVKNAFRSVLFDKPDNGKKLRFSTDVNGLLVFNMFPSLDSVKINITTDYPVLENNADSVNGNVYTWNFDKDTKKGINLVLENKVPEVNEDEKSNNENTLVNMDKKEKNDFFNKHPLLVGIIALVSFIVIAIIVSKVKIKG